MEEIDDELKPDYDNMYAIDFMEVIEKGCEVKLKKSTTAYKVHKKELNRIINIYNKRFGKTYNTLK